ncbi:MAG: hypothetical protein RBT78_12050, partial [Kiritimatiellia bacterium]|nr:hypothetical protein [Kiritimatiellia bacterium]
QHLSPPEVNPNPPKKRQREIVLNCLLTKSYVCTTTWDRIYFFKIPVTGLFSRPLTSGEGLHRIQNASG